MAERTEWFGGDPALAAPCRHLVVHFCGNVAFI